MLHKFTTTLNERAILAAALAAVLVGSLILAIPAFTNFSNLPPGFQEAAAASLPFLVDVHTEPKLKTGDAEVGSSYLKINPHWMDNFGELGCEECTLVEYSPGPQGHAGIAYTDGEPLNFKDAKRVRFFAMGMEGGEKVKFVVGGKEAAETNSEAPKSNPPTSSPSGKTKDDMPGAAGGSPVSESFKKAKFAVATEEVTLESDWTRYEIPVEGLDLASVDYPFGFILSESKGGKPVKFLLHSVVYEKETADYNVLQTEALSTEALLTAQLSANTTNATAQAAIEFSANASGGLEPYEFVYDFGDGDKEESDSPSAIHAFAEPGEYNSTVFVSDSANQTAAASIVVNISEPIQEDVEPPANVTETNATDADNSTLTDEGASANVDGTDSASPEDAGNDNDTSTSSLDEAPAGESIEELPDDEEPEDVGPAEDNATDNSPPVADAGNDLAGVPEGRLLLDGSKSVDPDGDEISYSWTQESGPDIDISGEDSLTPEITLPDLEEDSEIILELAVSDGGEESEDSDTVTIFVEYVEDLSDEVEEIDLGPADVDDSEWSPSEECEDPVECLSDDSGDTFVSAGAQDEEDTDLFSFEEFDLEEVQIDRVTIEIAAKKAGETGFVSFVVDDPEDEDHYATPDISIVSNSFDEYRYVWDEHPVTGDSWTVDSLNSLKAGYMYTAGLSGVEISEILLIIGYHTDEPQIEEEEPAEEETEPEEPAEPPEDEGGGDGADVTEENSEQGTEEESGDPVEEEVPEASDAETPANQTDTEGN